MWLSLCYPTVSCGIFLFPSPSSFFSCMNALGTCFECRHLFLVKCLAE